MKKSSMWLGIFAGTIILIAMVACCTFAPSATNSSNVYANESEVNLENLTAAFEKHAKGGTKDLTAFEKEVNTSSIYSGKGYVRVTMDDKGSVIGYKDDNGTPGFQTADSRVFALDIEPEKEKIVARDRHDRYYGRRSSGIGTYMLIGYMMGNQRRAYGGRYYSAPANTKFQKSGYHNRLKSKSSSSRSFRSGSSGSRRGSGGFGSGK